MFSEPVGLGIWDALAKTGSKGAERYQGSGWKCWEKNQASEHLEICDWILSPFHCV